MTTNRRDHIMMDWTGWSDDRLIAYLTRRGQKCARLGLPPPWTENHPAYSAILPMVDHLARLLDETREETIDRLTFIATENARGSGKPEGESPSSGGKPMAS